MTKRKTRMSRRKKMARTVKKFRRGESAEQFTGKIIITAAGLGFVTPDQAGEKDIFIPPRFINGAIYGDVVKVAMLPPRAGDSRTAGKVVEIVTRTKTSLVGELISGHRIRPLNRKFADDVKVSGSLCGAKRGDWVKVELLHGSGHADELRGTVKEKIGQAGTIQSDLDAVCSEFELPEPYSANDEATAEALEPRSIKRLDLRELFCLTIDPEDAKDFDDAISLAPGTTPYEVEIGIHIADVAAWIAPGSKFDRTAFEHGFTAYLPGRTLPMLPKGLTRSISLTADGDSLAHSIILTVDRNSGRVISSRRCHSRINVNKRLTFDQVQQFIDDGTATDWDEDFSAKLGELVALTRQMRNWRRKKEKFLVLKTIETRVMVDEEKNEIVGLVHKAQREADQLVEDCMLAANSAVASELLEKKIPGLFRIHDEPDQEKLGEFSEFVASTFGFYPGDLSNRSRCNEFLNSLPDDPRKPIIISAFLRSLPRAVYSEKSSLHFGLGKLRYSHFTSPIRRYSDLIVHQQLWAADTNDKIQSNKTMEKVGAACSEKEQRVDEAYYSANDRIKLRYLKEQLDSGADNMHEGMIAKILPAGMLVDIQDLGIYGFVPLESLGGKFSYNRSENKLADRRSRRSYKIGDYIYLQLTDIDFIRGSAIFQPPL
ncbi:MAG: ribonuclease R [Victivallaceae bacterium]|nr:ribonuclease R [Victivallaceae bacterium]